MLRILESQAPAKQTATDTINTLSSRLSSATLLEDRRAAILGLRSFAKLYPASVASGALRDLIAGLRRDGQDPDTLKVVLETLLMLFQPDAQSPEASDDIPLWLADEFTQRQDNITALLDLVETNEFYLRLYSLQLLSQICGARPQRTQEAIFNAPLGVSRLVAVLDDRREAVRNDGLILLAALTPTSAELQKVIAFENAFERVFNLIESEGGLTHGATTVQDCLTLLGNLLKLNPSNQAYFRESGCVVRVAKILAQVIKEEESSDGVSEWMRPQRDINLWGTLTVLQLFLVKGSQGTVLSQDAFWKSGVLQRVLQIAFHQTFGSNVRARALETCAHIIRGNASLQEQFGDLAVPTVRQKAPAANGHSTPVPNQKSASATPTPVEMSNVIESLLELTLESSSLSEFDIRLAACNCVKAFFEAHNGIRGHVLRRAIEGHKSGDDAVPNILTVLLEPPNTRTNTDPYQQWMAAVLLEHLLYDFSEAKALMLKVSEGDEATDEDYEVVTFVQSITSNVVAGVQHPEDERALLGYLMLLCTWLFEDPDSVNDLLSEGSTVQGLASAVKVASPTMPLVAGMCSFLLGIIYEFSTKDSPIPRATLQSVILKNLTREVYIDRLTKLRESPFVRDFEVLPIVGDVGLPDVYFEQTFVDFFKDNFSRLMRAIDRDPGFEVSILTNGVQKGVSRELVDTLRTQVDDTKSSLDNAEAELVALRQKLEQEELEHRKTRETSAVELGRIKNINQGLHASHEEELQKLQQDHSRQSSSLTSHHESTLAQLKRDHLTAMETAIKQHKAEKDYTEQRRGTAEREVTKLKDALAKQKDEAEKAARSSQRIYDEQQAEITTLHKSLQDLQQSLSKAQAESEQSIKTVQADFEKKLAQAQQATKDMQKELAQAQKATKDIEKELAGAKANTAKEIEKAKSSASKDTQATASKAKAALETAQKATKVAEDKAKTLQKRVDELEKSAKAAPKTKAAPGPKISDKELEELKAQAAKQKDTQTELDDLLVVFADLEAKRAGDKKRLKELGEEVSEDEDDGEGEGEGEDDEEEDGADEDDVD